MAWPNGGSEGGCEGGRGTLNVCCPVNCFESCWCVAHGGNRRAIKTGLALLSVLFGEIIMSCDSQQLIVFERLLGNKGLDVLLTTLKSLRIRDIIKDNRDWLIDGRGARSCVETTTATTVVLGSE